MNKLIFIIIGFVELHKGQDILLEAIKRIDIDLLKRCEFIIVGNKSSMFARKLETQIEEIPCVKMIGTVNRKEIHELITCSDILICPSREDSMPTVCAEAMMHKVPCIVSDATGTAEYITDEYDGLIFKNEDVDGLMRKIIWCLNNRNAIEDMGEKAYSIYQKIFSIEAFENCLLKHVNEMI